MSKYLFKHLSNYTNVFYFLKGRLEYTLSEKIFFRTHLVYLKTLFETCFEHTFSKRSKMSICQFLIGGLLFFIVLIVYPLQPL